MAPQRKTHGQKKADKKRSRKYKFTVKKHPREGIVSFCLGLASLGLFAITSMMSVQAKGSGSVWIGFWGVAALLLSIAGVVFSVLAFRKKEIHYRFPVLGAALCGFFTLFYLVLYVLGGVM